MFKLSTYERNNLASKFGTDCNSAVLECRTGTQPSDPQAAETGTLLAQITLSNPAFGSPTTGTVSLNLPVSASAIAAGDLGWGRLKQGANVIADGSFSLSGGGGDFIVDGATLTVAIDDVISITSLTFTVPES